MSSICRGTKGRQGKQGSGRCVVSMCTYTSGESSRLQVSVTGCMHWIINLAGISVQCGACQPTFARGTVAFICCWAGSAVTGRGNSSPLQQYTAVVQPNPTVRPMSMSGRCSCCALAGMLGSSTGFGQHRNFGTADAFHSYSQCSTSSIQVLRVAANVASCPSQASS
jgi:hypothetical protein